MADGGEAPVREEKGRGGYCLVGEMDRDSNIANQLPPATSVGWSTYIAHVAGPLSLAKGKSFIARTSTYMTAPASSRSTYIAV
jgi:hypothetical protein